MGLNFVGRDVFCFLGINTKLAEFHCLSNFPDLKNSMMASVTSGPMTDHIAVKSSAE